MNPITPKPWDEVVSTSGMSGLGYDKAMKPKKRGSTLYGVVTEGALGSWAMWGTATERRTEGMSS